jgi:hypothetical protein
MRFLIGTPIRHLIHDEIEHIPINAGHAFAFRIRIWGGRTLRDDSTVEGLPFVVLISQENNSAAPRWHVRKVANYVWAGILHFTQRPVFFFTDGLVMGHHSLYQHAFETFGNRPDRQCLWQPTAIPSSWEHLEDLIGTYLAR